MTVSTSRGTAPCGNRNFSPLASSVGFQPTFCGQPFALNHRHGHRQIENVSQLAVDGILLRQLGKVRRKRLRKLPIERIALARVHALTLRGQHFVFAEHAHALADELERIVRFGPRDRIVIAARTTTAARTSPAAIRPAADGSTSNNFRRRRRHRPRPMPTSFM